MLTAKVHELLRLGSSRLPGSQTGTVGVAGLDEVGNVIDLFLGIIRH